jgi:hypothetical protein
MLSRGYTGNARTIDSWRIGAGEIVWTAACVAAGFVVLAIDHVIGG